MRESARVRSQNLPSDDTSFPFVLVLNSSLSCKMPRFTLNLAERPCGGAVPSPPGFAAGALQLRDAVEADPAALQLRDKVVREQKQAAVWQLARSPASQLPMLALMMYMSGSGVQA